MLGNVPVWLHANHPGPCDLMRRRHGGGLCTYTYSLLVQEARRWTVPRVWKWNAPESAPCGGVIIYLAVVLGGIECLNEDAAAIDTRWKCTGV
ncbi:hypothetical protein BDW42DRAFT_164504 [Aspergillus taichungensis]|uniref:Uncharacterized protein n=1 Tax=Aspergillus taichungensis TaxID=482145 RepID=A0A2J5I1S6_9EURO|nr:hypothetical protein BDW42DRAFT_164504 [Aspergillus taichungensis]